jgi:hypothetical protein
MADLNKIRERERAAGDPLAISLDEYTALSPDERAKLSPHLKAQFKVLAETLSDLVNEPQQQGV